jgi:protein-disulfide isomerase
MKNIYKLTFYLFLFFLLSTTLYGKSILDITENDFVIGNKNAPITIIEYASLSCSHCASFHNDTLADLKKEYIDSGKIKFVFRDFPFNYPALLGSMVLQCIPNSTRYQYMNALYELQPKWVSRENAKSTQELFKIMQSGGMTKEEFDNCIYDTELEKKILENVMAAQNELNIQSTPSFLINGMLVEGNKSIKEFRQIIDKILPE